VLGRRPRIRDLDAASADLWTRAFDRLERGVARYFDKVSFMHDRRVRTELREIGVDLSAALEVFRAAGDERGAAEAGADVPLVNAVHRSGTLCAHAIEAAMTAHDAAWRKEIDRMSGGLDAVRILVKGISELADGSLLHV
jgi:hypothetical protein